MNNCSLAGYCGYPIQYVFNPNVTIFQSNCIEGFTLVLFISSKKRVYRAGCDSDALLTIYHSRSVGHFNTKEKTSRSGKLDKLYLSIYECSKTSNIENHPRTEYGYTNETVFSEEKYLVWNFNLLMILWLYEGYCNNLAAKKIQLIESSISKQSGKIQKIFH